LIRYGRDRKLRKVSDILSYIINHLGECQ
jgi:hypothetical protein